MKALNPKKIRRNRRLAATVITLGFLSTAVYSHPTMASYSNSANATVTASAQTWTVSTLTVTAPSSSTASVRWTALPEYTSYNLQWSKTSDFSSPYSARVTGNSHVASGLDELTTYYFRIQSVGAPANSGWSSPVSTRTPELPYPIDSPADIVAFDSRGELWNYDKAGSGTGSRKSISPAGNPIPSSFHVVDWDGDKVQDLVVKTTAGELNFWKGLPDGTFRISSIGTGGWKDYDITVGKWKKTDALPSVIAIEKATGDMYLYPNSNDLGFATRSKFDFGWKDIPIQLLDFDQDGNADIIGKFQDGVLRNGELRQYRTNGNGSFIVEARKAVGTGWNAVDSVAVVHDAEGPGTVAFVAREISTGILFYYKIENSAIAERRQIGNGLSGYKMPGN